MSSKPDVMASEVETEEAEYNRCAVCRAKRKGNFLRISLCRACAVFFRRNRNSAKEFVCRSLSGKCKIQRDKIYACSKCRYEKIRNVLENLRDQEEPKPGPSKSVEWNYEPIPEAENFSKYLDELPPMNVSPMLRRFSRCYNDLGRQRLIIDFGSLNNLPFNEKGRVEAQATFSSSGGPDFVRKLNDEIFAFIKSASDDFAVMKAEYQKQLFTNFVKIFLPFEGFYRTLKYYNPSCIRFFATFGRILDIDKIEAFYDDGMKDNEFKESAIKIIKEETAKNSYILAPAMNRLRLTDEECIGVIALLLWHIVCETVSDDLNKLAMKNTNAVLHDLYRYYRSIGLTDYSARLGEIFVFLSLLENIVEQSAEMSRALKVFEVFEDDAQEVMIGSPNEFIKEKHLDATEILGPESF